MAGPLLSGVFLMEMVVYRTGGGLGQQRLQLHKLRLRNGLDLLKCFSSAFFRTSPMPGMPSRREVMALRLCFSW